jgi:hypothetical protein
VGLIFSCPSLFQGEARWGLTRSGREKEKAQKTTPSPFYSTRKLAQDRLLKRRWGQYIDLFQDDKAKNCIKKCGNTALQGGTDTDVTAKRLYRIFTSKVKKLSRRNRAHLILTICKVNFTILVVTTLKQK